MLLPPLLGLVLLSFTATTAVLSITQEECENEYLPELLDCLDSGSADCDYLPVLDSAVDDKPRNELGYWMQQIRDSPTTKVFVVGNERFYNMLIVDTPPLPIRHLKRWKCKKMGKCNTAKGGKSSSSFSSYDDDDDDDDDILSHPKDVTVAFVDLPDNHIQFDAQRKPIGHHSLSALEEIMTSLGRPMDDIAKIDIIYSHQHQDHVGGANVTLSLLTQDMGFPAEDIRIVATKGSASYFDELQDAGVFSYRAVPPTIIYEEEMEYKIGLNSNILMTPVEEAHTSAGSDVIFFMERDGDHPPILMMVDIISPRWAPLFRFGQTSDLLGYLTVHDQLLRYDLGEDGHFVGGHVNHVGNRNDIVLNQAFTNAVLAAAKQARGSVNLAGFLAQAGLLDPNNPNFFNRYLPTSLGRQALDKACIRIALERVGCTMAAADVVMPSLCEIAGFFTSVEF